MTWQFEKFLSPLLQDLRLVNLAGCLLIGEGSARKRLSHHRLPVNKTLRAITEI